MIKDRPILPDSFKKIPFVADIFAKDPRIVLVYLFGSAATGDITPLSDIDIAYLVHQKEIFSLDDQLSLAGEVADFLHTDEVDMVCLNDAPLSFQYAVLKQAKVLFVRDPQTKEEYETFAILRFLDFSPLRQIYFQSNTSSQM